MSNKRISKKLVILFCMLIATCICLAGCANIDFVTYCNSDGSIHEYVHVNLDEETILKHGYSISDVQKEIDANSEQIVASLIQDYNHKLLLSYKDGKISLDEYNSFVNQTHDIKIAKIKRGWENNSYVIGLSFKNSSIYRKYYQLLNNAEHEPSTQSKQIQKLFYTKTYYYGSVGYSDYSLFNQVYNHYALMFSNKPNENTTLSYSYAMSSSRYHSNADSIIVDSNGNYIHTWQVQPNELDASIYFYTLKANKSAWILTCIAISTFISSILCLIGIFKLKNRNKNIINN